MTARARSLAVAAAMIVFLSATPAFPTTTTGVLDTTFNGNGKVAISHSWTTGLMAPAPHNGLYVALDAVTNIDQHGDYPVHLTRLLSNGTPDPAFGSHGHADVDLGNHGQVFIAGLVPDGTGLLVVLFNQTDRTFGVTRLTANGHLDTTLGGTGHIVFPPPENAFGGIAAAHVLPDGRIELVLSRDRGVEPHDGGFYLLRLHSDGSADTSFAPYGVKTLETWSNIGDGPNSSPEVAFVNDAKIYMTLPYGAGRTTLMRRTSDGSPDPTFNGNGARGYACPNWQSTPPSGPDLSVDTFGRPLLVCTTNFPYDLFIARFTIAGAGDHTFGHLGLFRAWIHADSSDDIRLGVDSVNRIVIEYMVNSPDATGTVDYIRRYTSAGLIDSAFGTSGTATLKFGPIYALGAGPAFGTNRIYLSLYPNQAPCEIDIAVTA